MADDDRSTRANEHDQVYLLTDIQYIDTVTRHKSQRYTVTLWCMDLVMRIQLLT